MDIIFTILILIFLWQQCVCVPHNSMGYHTVNVHYSAVRNIPVLVYLIMIQINMKQTRVQKISFHVNHNVSHSTVHDMDQYEERTIFYMCYTSLSYVTTGKVYTPK